MKTLILILILGSVLAQKKIIAQENKYDIGQFYPEFQYNANEQPVSLSFLSKNWPEPEQWRIQGRAKMQELLAYAPEPVPLEPVILEKVKKDGYTRYKVQYSITSYRKTEAFLLIPDGLTKPAPAVIALHDHGAFYYFGKEKIVETESQPQILKDFIKTAYGGRTYADELARRGFVVLCPDAFYFGSQRLDVNQVPEYFKKNYPDLNSSDENKAISAHNQFYHEQEQIMAKYLFDSGTTWPGVLFYGDRVSVDYLLSRPEVDPSRVGCIGLSIGGFRSAHLFGLDPRISVCVDAGWMTSYTKQMDTHLRHHTWMIYVPRQLEFLDLPDVASLNAPRPLMIINCKKDELYTVDAMQTAADKLAAIYKKLDASDRFKAIWYDVPHSLNVEMQNDAIAWLEKWLKNESASQPAKIGDSSLTILPGEGWWGALVNEGHIMPFVAGEFSFDLSGDCDGNQSVPFLISNKGRYIWSEEPFRFSFKNNHLSIDNAHAPVVYGKNGSTLKEAYLDASHKYFPSSGFWPDSLLVKSPQYNLWIELQYNPNQQDVLKYARQVLQNGWPAGVLMIDDNWTNYYGQFDFDRVKFPDPKSLITTLHSMGFKVMLWICPFITSDTPTFRELEEKKLLLLDSEGNKNADWKSVSKPLLMRWWNGYSAHLDLTNPDAFKWLHERLNFLRKEYGVDGFKLDAGDVNDFIVDNLVSFKKVSPVEHTYAWNKIGLDYTLNEYRATWKMGGQPLVERLRDKYHTWEDVQKLIPHTIVQQLIGYTFTCPDMIGGGDNSSFLPGSKLDQKLIVRSAQCSALMPMMQFSAAPWRVLDSVHLAAVSKIVRLRQQYLPYIMQVLRNSAQSGLPALRSLEYEYPGQNYLNINDQFLLGDKLMVAPVVTSDDTRKVIIPGGKWKHNNKIVSGPAVITCKVAIDELLIFEKVR
jgi:dienelactone hydrolase